MTDPIHKTVTVPLSAGEAFDLFTTAIDAWWPKQSHSVSADTGDGNTASVRMEPREGGRVIETLPDGGEVNWATVTT